MADPVRRLNRLDTPKRLSDQELRKYKFRVTSPETTSEYDRSRPSEEEIFDRIIHDYNIPHTINSGKGYVWCAFCQRPTHYFGGLAKYEDGKVRSVGWACCAKRLDVNLKEGWREFRRNRVRADRLHQFDAFDAILVEVQREVAELEGHSSVCLYDLVRGEFEREMHGLWKWLSGIAFHSDGWVEQEVKITDYSGIALKREENEEQDGDEGKLRGQRTRRQSLRRRISGWQFVHPNNNAGRLCEEAQRIVKRCVEFYSEGYTDDISDREFSQKLGDVRQLVSKLEKLEAISHALLKFFSRSNRELIVALRNQLLLEPVYAVTLLGIKRRPQDGDKIELTPPLGYEPVKVRSLGRLKRTLR